MAITLNHPRTGAETRAAGRPTAYQRSVGTGLLGLTAVLVGAWGLICGYVGPYFGFRPLGYNAWSGSLQEGLLHAAPGAAAIIAGLMLMAMGPARRAVHRFGLVFPAALLLAAGAWFVIGPVAWPAIEPGAAFMYAGPLRNLLNVACASYAPGLVLVMLGGMALKASTVPPTAIDDPMTPAEAGRVPEAAGVDEGGPDATRVESARRFDDAEMAGEEPTASRNGV